MKVLLSGGGTGGHVYPAIAIANKIKENHPDAQFLFVGTSTGIEADIVPKNGYEIKTITVQGFKRKIDLDNVKRGFKLMKGLNEARKIVKEFNPDIVIGTGGYVSGPVLFCAGSTNAVTVVHEQNSFPGVTNKILSKKADLIITCFDETKKRFPEKGQEKVVLIGNPVREELLKVSKEDARKNINMPLDKQMVLAYGGSGGFKKINDAMVETVKAMVEKDIAFIYATGKRFYEQFMSKIEHLELKDYQRVVPYLEDMTNSLSACDIVIGSAGATSLSEITALGKPSIIIPKAYTAENHQEYNARSISDNGAGVCILESELTPGILTETLLDILSDESKLAVMESNSKAIGKPNAVDDIYKTIIDYKESKKVKPSNKE